MEDSKPGSVAKIPALPDTPRIWSRSIEREAQAQVQVQRRFRVALPGKRGEYDLYAVAAHDERVIRYASATAPEADDADSVLGGAGLS